MQHDVTTGNSNSSTLNDNLINICIKLGCDLMQFSISFGDYYTYHLLRNSFLHQKHRHSYFLQAVGIYPEFTYSLYSVTVCISHLGNITAQQYFCDQTMLRPISASWLSQLHCFFTYYVMLNSSGLVYFCEWRRTELSNVLLFLISGYFCFH